MRYFCLTVKPALHVYPTPAPLQLQFKRLDPLKPEHSGLFRQPLLGTDATITAPYTVNPTLSLNALAVEIRTSRSCHQWNQWRPRKLQVSAKICDQLKLHFCPQMALMSLPTVNPLLQSTNQSSKSKSPTQWAKNTTPSCVSFFWPLGSVYWPLDVFCVPLNVFSVQKLWKPHQEHPFPFRKKFLCKARSWSQVAQIEVYSKFCARTKILKTA